MVVKQTCVEGKESLVEGTQTCVEDKKKLVLRLIKLVLTVSDIALAGCGPAWRGAIISRTLNFFSEGMT